MNSKNILISIGVLGIGLILYKLLLGFVLPIALFVALGYVLKLLLKGSDSDQAPSQILKDITTPSSTENIVEIKPIEEDKTVKENKPIEDDKTIGETNIV